ncbi:MAG: hypothetical protein K0R22_611 [Sporomusa sp.]|jgi:hypothetical protein|nr:hypothetical protein [Sporomusa sp.]
MSNKVVYGLFLLIAILYLVMYFFQLNILSESQGMFELPSS